jgi:predicted PurR-regulated permease PerM
MASSHLPNAGYRVRAQTDIFMLEATIGTVICALAIWFSGTRLVHLGVDNAILYGMLAALMTIIPDVGIVTSSLLPISVAWTSTGMCGHRSVLQRPMLWSTTWKRI